MYGVDSCSRRHLDMLTCLDSVCTWTKVHCSFTVGLGAYLIGCLPPLSLSLTVLSVGRVPVFFVWGLISRLSGFASHGSGLNLRAGCH